MKLKRYGLILLLIATTGFGFHNWYFDNKIDACTSIIDDRIEARKRYIDGIMRYRDLKQEWQVESLAENIGQLFKRTDLIMYKKIREASIEGVTTVRENIRATKRIALIEFAYNVDGNDYSEEIANQFDSIVKVEMLSEVDYMEEVESKTEELYNNILLKWGDKINFLQKELKEKQKIREVYSQKRNVWYLVYLTIQIIGIALTILDESYLKKRFGKPTVNRT